MVGVQISTCRVSHLGDDDDDVIHLHLQLQLQLLLQGRGGAGRGGRGVLSSSWRALGETERGHMTVLSQY